MTDVKRIIFSVFTSATLLVTACSNGPRATPGAPEAPAATAAAPVSTPSAEPSPEPSDAGVLTVAYGKPINIDSPDEGTLRVVVTRPKVSFGTKTTQITVKSLAGRVDVNYWEVMVQGSDGTVDSLGSFSSGVTTVNKGQQIKREMYLPDSFLKDKKLQIYVAESSDNSTPIAIWK